MTTSAVLKRPGVLTKAKRRLSLSIEHMEERALLSGFGMLQGYASYDAASGGGAKVGATIDLFKPDGSTLVASTTTNSDGYYQFKNVPTGNYLLEEAPSPNYVTTGVQINSLFDKGTAANNNTAIAVNVADSSTPTSLAPIQINALTDPAGSDPLFGVTNGPFNSYTTTGNSITFQYHLQLSGGTVTPQSIYSFCTDLFHANPSTYGVQPSLSPPSTALTANVGEIGYLYNHFGTTLLSPTQGAGLQLAIWELLYDNTPNLSSGNFTASVNPSDPTSGAAIAAAQNYLKLAAGKNESAFFLNDTDPNTGTLGSQGMIATESFNFINTTAACNTSDITNISYNVTHGSTTTTYSSLGGHVQQGDHVTVNFTVAPGHADLLSLVSYVAPGSSYSDSTASQQFIYDSDSMAFGPGKHSLSVDVPNCYFQVDFVCGPPITQFNPSQGITYHDENMFIDSANGGTVACVPSCNPGDISNISYSIDGGPLVTSLSGNVHAGDTVQVFFTVGQGDIDQVSLVSYTSNSSFDLTKQNVYKSSTATFGPGAHSLTVVVPSNSYFQVDFVCGTPITVFNPSQGITYHGQNRFIDSAQGGPS